MGAGGEPRTSADSIQFVELIFETDANKMKPEVPVSLAELGVLVSEVERLSWNFMALQRTFETRTRYRKDWEDSNPAAYANWVAYQATLKT